MHTAIHTTYHDLTLHAFEGTGRYVNTSYRVSIDIDSKKLARQLGPRALGNKTRKCTAVHGAIKVQLVGILPKPTE